MNLKNEFFEVIDANIAKRGYHITTVIDAVEPRFTYTIGLQNTLNFDLIFAGGLFYMNDEVNLILSEVINSLQLSSDNQSAVIDIGILGTVTLSPVHISWAKLMALGVFDYFPERQIHLYQVIPDATHKTLDVPNMQRPFDVNKEDIWQWLEREWAYPVPRRSRVTTNLEALQGKTITEVTRWEEDEWEMFVGPGPDVEPDDVRIVSLGTVLGIDSSILPAINLEIGKGIWREDNSDWNVWR